MERAVGVGKLAGAQYLGPPPVPAVTRTPPTPARAGQALDIAASETVVTPGSLSPPKYPGEIIGG
jgi:hypothetical protein